MRKHDEVVKNLLRCLWLYPNYRVDSRGPCGLIIDSIKALKPELTGDFAEGEDAGDILKKYFPEEFADGEA